MIRAFAIHLKRRMAVMTFEKIKKGKDIISTIKMVPLVVILTISIILGWHQQSEASTIKLTVAYNNVSFDSRLEDDWGFSCFIEGIGENILFDSGGSGSILLNNMKHLGIKPESINSVFLSHPHFDHVGGLIDLLEKKSNINVFLLESFPEYDRHTIQDSGAKIKILTNSTKLLDHVHSTGDMIFEHSLIIETSDGLVIITGCAHPGIVNIVKKSKSLLNSEVLLVMGGFHLLRKSKHQIETIIDELKNLGVKKVAPSHCTGKEATDLFREAWGNNFLEGGLGAVIEVPK
jgi:7,8-dihydropterin-6-yl-methyl-4-(beta-D-ribofuranosyl)aminobenzene 5'-phosphate synthase